MTAPGTEQPTSIDLKKDRGLTIAWADGTTSYYTIAYLRRMSPSADVRQLREEASRNPLTVLSGRSVERIEASNAELVGNYAIRITFNDGHSTGIYSWQYLREIDPAMQTPQSDPSGPPHA